MNSFIRGFFSIFNVFPSSKLDDSMQDLYNEMGWGTYKNPLTCNGSMTPYSFYNEDMDSIQLYFKDHQFYTQPLNKAMNLYISFDTKEVIGVEILNIKKLLEVKISP